MPEAFSAFIGLIGFLLGMVVAWGLDFVFRIVNKSDDDTN